MAEIRGKVVGGFSFKELTDVTKGPVEKEIKPEELQQDENEEKEIMDVLGSFSKLECLDYYSYDGEEPFDAIAREMENVLEDGTVKKRILKEGYGRTPGDGVRVSVHYNGYLHGEAYPFDSTYARKKPFSFIIGEGTVIPGLEIAIKTMKLTEKSQFLVYPELAYKRGGFKRIPPNSTVLFEIELFVITDFVEHEEEAKQRDFSVVYPFCQGRCILGKRHFRLKNYADAVKEYKLAINRLEDAQLHNQDQHVKAEEMLVRLYTNALVCYVNLKLPKKGCICANRIYDRSRGNKTFKVDTKIYFNHAKCLVMLGEFDHAERKLYQAKKLEPNNERILQELASLKKAQAEGKKRDATFGRALLR